MENSELRHEHTKGLYGHITHTELISSDSLATRSWCAKVLGWTFRAPMPVPGGEYHVFVYSEKGGGGIRQTGPGEQPGCVPTVHVEDAQASFDPAIREGAEELVRPVRVMEGVTIAVVRAPGGVTIGFSGA